MAAVDQVEKRVGGGRLVVALLHLAEADVVDDEEVGASPALEAAGVRVVGEAGVEIVEEIDAPGVADVEHLLAGAAPESLEDVALAGAAEAGDHEVVVAVDEVEAGEVEHERLVERRLEVPVEGLEGLVLTQAAEGDAPGDALLDLLRRLGVEDALEEGEVAGALALGPGEVLVEGRERVGQAEELDGPPESGSSVVVGRGWVSSAALGHGGVVLPVAAPGTRS